jgi:excisionase family DNA binding protein
MSDKDWLTPVEVAEMVCVNVQTVRRWIQSGRLKSHRVSPKVQRVNRADVDQFFQATTEVVNGD